MALILAVGFVVDDAIVMLENIVRHLEMGEGPVKAALNGSREIGFHHRLHDPVAGGRLHSRPFHGGHPRPSVPGVCRHHRGGHSHFGGDLPDAHPHALQPVSAPACGRAGSGPALRVPPSGSTSGMLERTRSSLRWFLGNTLAHLVFLVLVLISHGRAVSGSPQGVHPKRGPVADLRC